MIFGYARVSTKTQARDGNSLDAQQAALTAAGAEKIYTDTFTGTKIERPEFDRLRAQLRRGDVLIVARATDPDFREGRPPKFDTEQLDHAMELLENHSYAQTAKLTGISKSTLIRERKRRRQFGVPEK